MGAVSRSTAYFRYLMYVWAVSIHNVSASDIPWVKSPGKIPGGGGSYQILGLLRRNSSIDIIPNDLYVQNFNSSFCTVEGLQCSRINEMANFS